MKRIINFLLLISILVFGIVIQSNAITVNFGVTQVGGCNFTSYFKDTVDGVISGALPGRKWLLLHEVGGVKVRVDSSTFAIGHHTFASADSGFYDIVEYYTSGGDTDSVVKNHIIYVNHDINTSVRISPTGYQCIPATVTLINTSDTVFGGAPHNFTWSITLSGHGTLTYNTTLASTHLPITLDTAGLYDVTISNTENYIYNCPTSTNTFFGLIKLDTFAKPRFSTIDTFACSVPSIALFNNTTINGGSYIWHFGDGGTSTAVNPYHNYTRAGIFTDTLIAYSLHNACADTLIKVNYVHVDSSTHFGLKIASTQACINQNVTLIDTSTVIRGRLTYDNVGHHLLQTFSGTPPTTIFNPSFTYSVAGTYSITDSVYINASCSAYEIYTVTVNTPPTGTFTADHPNYCAAPDVVTFSPSISGGTGSPASYTYRWNFGDSTALVDTSILQSPTHTYLNNSSAAGYGVILLVKDSIGCIDSVVNGNPTNLHSPNMIHIFPPTFNNHWGTGPSPIDSGCIPLLETYNVSIIQNATLMDFTIDSVYFWYTDGTYSTHIKHGTPFLGNSDTATLTVGSPNNWDTVTFFYHISPLYGGCIDTAIDTVKVSELHAIYPSTDTLSVSGGTLDSIVCPNTNVTFHGSGCTNCSSFRWIYNQNAAPLFPPGAGVRTLNLKDTSITYNIPGKHYIMSISDVNGCTDTGKFNLYVMPPGKATPTVSQATCAGSGIVDYYNYFNFNTTGVSVSHTGLPAFSPTSPTIYYSWSIPATTTSTVTDLGTTVSNYSFGPGLDTPVVVLKDSITIWLTIGGTVDTLHCTDTSQITVHVINPSSIDGWHHPINKDLICKGTSVPFTASIPPFPGYYTRYTWLFGDGFTSFSTISGSTSHIYNSYGIFYPSLILKNIYGCSDTLTTYYNADTFSVGNYDSITVGGIKGRLVSTSPTNVCADSINSAFLHAGIFSFTDSSTDTLFTILANLWSTNGTIFNVGGLHQTDTFAEGIHKVYLKDTDNVGCKVVDTVTVSVLKQHAFFTVLYPNVAGCTDSPIKFIDTNSNCTYHWDFGDGTTGSTHNPSHIYTATGIYHVKLRITTLPGGSYPAGCVDSFKLADSIRIQTYSSSFVLNQDSFACPPAFIIATNTSIFDTFGHYRYAWSVYPPGATLLDTTSILPLYTYINSGDTTTTLTLNAHNAWGCSYTSSHTISVKGPKAHVKVSTGGCYPYTQDTLQIVDTLDMGTILNISWHTGDGYDTTIIDPTDSILVPLKYTYASVGTYKPYVVISAGGCFNVVIPDTSLPTYMDSTVVFRMPVKITHDTTICHNGSITITAIDTLNPPYTYSWSPSTGLPCSTCMSITVSPSAATVYSVYVRNSIGCYNTVSTRIGVDSVPVLNVSVSQTSICTGLTDTLQASGTKGTYYWMPSIDLSDSVGKKVIVHTDTISTYYVTVTDTFGCTNTDTINITLNPLPTLVVPASFPIVCDSMPVNFISNSTVSPSSYTWKRSVTPGIIEPANTGTGNITEPLINTSNHGVTVNYIFTVTATATGCHTDTNKLSVIVMPNLKLSNAHVLDSICSGSTYTYIAATNHLGDTLTWVRNPVGSILPSSNSANTDTVSEALSDTINTNTIYKFTIRDSGCISTQNVTLKVKPIPVLSSSTPRTVGPVCDSNLVRFIGQTTPLNVNVKWSRNVTPGIFNAAGSGIVDSIHEYLDNITDSTINVVYTFTVTANACSSDTNIVHVLVNPKINITSYTDTSICTGSSFTYLPSTNYLGGASYSWKRVDSTSGANLTLFPNNTTGTGSLTDSVVSNIAGTQTLKFMYTVFINNNSNCKDSQLVTIKVTPQSSQPILSDSFFNNGICSGSLYHTFGTINQPNPGEIYTWSLTPSLNGAIWKEGITGQYVLANFYNNSIDSPNTTITVKSSISGIGCRVTSDHRTFAMGAGNAQDTSTLHIETFGTEYYINDNLETYYQWGYDSILTLKPVVLYGQNSQNYHNPALTSNEIAYWVETSGSNGNGCIQKTYYSLNWLSVNSLSTNEGNLLTVFPNPANNIVFIRINEDLQQYSSIEIYNVVGQKMKSIIPSSNKSSIDISNMPAGSYWIVYNAGGFRRAEALFIKN